MKKTKQIKIDKKTLTDYIKKSAKGKLHSERYVFETYRYSLEKLSIKPYKITKKNKDGSLTNYGISRRGHRYCERIYTFKDYDKIEKVFKKAKKESKAGKILVTGKAFYYDGIYYKKTKKLKGVRGTIQLYNIGDKTKRTIKGKKEYYTTSHTDILHDLVEFAIRYNIVFDNNLIKGLII